MTAYDADTQAQLVAEVQGALAGATGQLAHDGRVDVVVQVGNPRHVLRRDPRGKQVGLAPRGAHLKGTVALQALDMVRRCAPTEAEGAAQQALVRARAAVDELKDGVPLALRVTRSSGLQQYTTKAEGPSGLMGARFRMVLARMGPFLEETCLLRGMPRVHRDPFAFG